MEKWLPNPRKKIIACIVAFAACAAASRAQVRLPQEAPLPVEPGRAAGEEPLLLLPGEELKLVPSTPPPLEAAPDRPFRLKLTPLEIRPVLPRLPSVFSAPSSLASQLRIFVKGYRFQGHTVFREGALQKAVERFKGREVTSAELEQARQELTLLYVNAGFINSGAVLEDQDLQGGIVTFTLIEGRLTGIEVDGHWWFRGWWLRHALRRSAGEPLNMKSLKQGLELLRQDPNLRQINAELRPGGKPGESILDVKVKERQPFRLALDFSNRRPPSVGAEIAEVTASMLNLTGHGDPITLRYGLAHTTSETLDRWEWSGVENLEGSYEFPITPWKTTLQIHASRNDSSIVEEAFTALDITSRSQQFGVTLRQPMHETLNDVLAVSLTADYRKSDTFLLGRPFSLSPGAIDGETKVFVLRLGVEYVHRTPEQVLALRSTFHVGIDAFGATRHRDAASDGRRLPDGEFFAWLGQGQYVRRLFGTDTLAIVRVNAALSNHPLLSLEQFSIGGAQSVRGYRENQLLRDNGVFASLEFRIPVWRGKAKTPLVSLAPFFDIATGWDNVEFRGPAPRGGADHRQDTLVSGGLGVIFTPNQRITARLDWGYAFNRDLIVKDGRNLQDYGLHFTVSIAAF